MQYAEFAYWDGDTVVATERMEDDHSYDVLSKREPTDSELTDYYGQEGEQR